MKSMRATIAIALLVVCGAVFPNFAYAADWTVSPHAAQIASGSSEQQAASDATDTGGLQKKNVGKGVMFSLIIPGTGQLYAGQWWRALPWFAIEVASWAMFASYHGKGQDKTDEYEAFAGPRDTPNRFNYRSYMFAEFEVATDRPRDTNNPYQGNFEDWLLLPWADRSVYLPAPFTHDVLDDDEQQFFEMIGKYFSQFGWGWRDTHSGDADASDWTTAHPDYANGFIPDDPATIYFDGSSPLFYHYRDMRGEANDFLDKGNTAMEIVLVNHVLSALDAAIAVRGYNKRNAPRPEVGDLKLRYDAKRVHGEMTRYLTLSVALD